MMGTALSVSSCDNFYWQLLSVLFSEQFGIYFYSLSRTCLFYGDETCLDNAGASLTGQLKPLISREKEKTFWVAVPAPKYCHLRSLAHLESSKYMVLSLVLSFRSAVQKRYTFIWKLVQANCLSRDLFFLKKNASISEICLLLACYVER